MSKFQVDVSSGIFAARGSGGLTVARNKIPDFAKFHKTHFVYSFWIW